VPALARGNEKGHQKASDVEGGGFDIRLVYPESGETQIHGRRNVSEINGFGSGLLIENPAAKNPRKNLRR